MHSPVEDIKARLDIIEVVGGYIRLAKAGINYKANCPFHGEKTPSFFVSPARQMWHCFGCGKGGDLFSFVMEIEGHDFPEALKLLAGRAGVVLKREDPAVRSEKNRLYDICEEAARLYEDSLALTPAVKQYLKKRGVADATIKEFRVGFAPQSWDYVISRLLPKGFRREELVSAGLAVRSEDRGSWYDRFRGRIMFPITDASGRVIGFGGRIFDEVQTSSSGTSARAKQPDAGAKYVNTPATSIYDKSQVLYGFDHSRQDIRTKNQVVLVEGYMDCIMSHQAGVKNTIAVSGTALTPFQLKIVRRLCDTVVSSFDTDAAGDSATKRSLSLAAQFGFERKVAVIPSGKDPADAVLDDPQLWSKAVAEAKPVVDFYFEKAFRDFSPATPQGKRDVANLLLPWIAELGNEIEKAHWVKELSRKLSIDEQAVWDELRKRTHAHNHSGERLVEEEQRTRSRKELLEERLLTLLSLIPVHERVTVLDGYTLLFSQPLDQEIFRALSDETSPAAEHEGTRKHIELLRFKGEILAHSLKGIQEEILLCRKELEKEDLRARLALLGTQIEKLEQAGKSQEAMVKLADFRTLSEQMKSFS